MLRILALALAVSTLSNCSSSVVLAPKSAKTTLKCPQIPLDLSREAKRGTSIGTQDDPFDVSLVLIKDIRRKNDALKRALALYRACRAT